MKRLANKRILLGVTGSIAAYKAADLVRRYRAAGAQVQVMMTRAAGRFITPLTLQALSDHPVHHRHLDLDSEAALGHIRLARWADAVVVAPASADSIARLAHGRADDLLATVCLATEAPLAVAPAMNRRMWEHPATQDNLATLRRRGVHVFGPASGEQACGEIGPGRMLEPERVAIATAELFAAALLQGVRVLVTAGPTQEAIDPVRFVSNRSSGKMGYALAAAAAEAGAVVTLVSGPVALAAPAGVQCVAVRSAAHMFDEVMARVAAQNIVIAAAAVADYRPVQRAAHKLKRREETLTLALERTPDILAGVAALRDRPLTIGFAAETEDLEANARAKLEAKGIDMIAANLVGEGGLGFDSDENAVSLLWRGGGRTELPRATKERLARQMIECIAERYHGKGTAEDH